MYAEIHQYNIGFNCKISDTNYSIGYVEEGANGPMGCSASIVIPVLEFSAQQIGNWSVSHIVGEGFEAKYKLKDEELFTECTESGGRCGFEDSQNTTCCLCSDGSVRYTSSATPGMFFIFDFSAICQ